ncbi:MAG TPA: ABC transporter permease [Planctomycetaceae bacterium]|jgi:lipopolysaccharide transport system permease protein
MKTELANPVTVRNKASASDPSEAAVPDSDSVAIRVIEPARGWIKLNLGELWRYRDLFMLLIWRDVAARYRQSVVGYGWAVIKPVLSTVIFTFIFGKVAGLPSDGVPYPIFSLAALLPWMFFSGALAGITSSVVGSGGLLSKVYFPRLILPLVSVAAGLAELGIQALILGCFMLWYRIAPGWPLALAPVFILMAVVTALGFGFWLTALNVKYRDVGMALPFFLQALMWMCPIVYSSRMVPEKWRGLYGLNPMVGVIEGFRWSILGGAPPDWGMMFVSFSVVAALFVGGLYYFRKVEMTFADVI